MADILDLEVERPDFVETTALGAAMLAAVGVGLYASLPDAVAAMRGPTRSFSSKMDGAIRTSRLARYRRALLAA